VVTTVRALRACAVAATLFGSAAGVATPPAGPASVLADVGGRSLVLPPPPGWVVVDIAGEAAHAPFSRFVSGNERVLAGFAPRMDADVPSGEALMKLGLAASTASLESEDIDAARFAEILASFRENLPEAKVVVQDADALGLLVLVEAQTDAGEPLPGYVSATLMLLTRVNSRFVRLALFDFSATAAGAAAFRATAMGWLVALRVANAPPA
jgi:hypothetical protein